MVPNKRDFPNGEVWTDNNILHINKLVVILGLVKIEKIIFSIFIKG
jgi:hypothetical protein